MATVEDFIYHKLSTTANIAAIVGTRIYRLKMPDNPTLPAITYETAFGDYVESFDGFSDIRLPTIRIHCWANTAAIAQDLAEKVRVALHGFKGTYSDKVIHNILEWSITDLFDEEIEVFHVACSCKVWYT